MNGERLIMNGERVILPFVRMYKCIFFCLLLLLVGCERRDLTYYETAEITLTVDWSQCGLDNEEEAARGATAVFYPTDGGEPKIFLMGDYSREAVRLPVGTYNVILFNRSFTDFSNTAFRGRDKYETLEAYSKQIATRVDGGADTRTIIASPEKLASTSVEGFVVTEDMLGNYSQTTFGRSGYSATSADGRCTLHFVPEKRTHEVVAVIRVEGLNNIRSATCRLDGIAESVFLATGKTSGVRVEQEFLPSNPLFDEGSLFNGTLTGRFNVFDIDFSSNHSLHFDAKLVDGKSNFEGNYNNVEVTKKDNGEGIITIYVEARTDKIPDVKPEGGSDSGFDVDVGGWGDEENTDVPI